MGAAPREVRADRIWWDGSRDTENGPPGKLLSDNPGYWGESVPTGVDYSYQTPPNNPGDPDRRLLNGIPEGDWNQTIGLANVPIVVTFDFKRFCTFSEFDITTRSHQRALQIELADTASGPWRTVFNQTLEASPDKLFQRIPLTQKPAGRFARFTLNAIAPARNNYLTYLAEVIAWGDAPLAPQPPGSLAPVIPATVVPDGKLPSVPGAERSAFSPAQFNDWKQSLGARSNNSAVWSRLPAWDSMTNAPILPSPEKVNQPVTITMARNETQPAAIALSNTSLRSPLNTRVSLSNFGRVDSRGRVTPLAAGEANIGAQLRVGGMVSTRWSGSSIGPLLGADNIPGTNVLRRFVLNADGIRDFPRLTLSPGGSAVLWLLVSTRGLAPGTYQAQLAGEGVAAIPVRVRVVDVTLPDPLVYINSWSHITTMFPFTYGDRLEREATYKSSLGINVWQELPTPGSAAEIARRRGKIFSHLRLIPPDYVNRGFNNQLKVEDLTDKDRALITDYVHDLVKQTRALGMGYDDWYGELWDEPGRGNSAVYGALARIVKAADPKVHIFMNPIFWESTGSAPDDVIFTALSPFYRDLIDVSVPQDSLLYDHPKSAPLFDAPHWIRASYAVTSQGGKGEASLEVETHRRRAWAAFARGYNGWAFFSYYAPVGDPWDDLDGPLPDYAMVYPGPRGPIASRRSESVRQGWQDFRLLTFLQQHGRKTELNAILKGYADGKPLEPLREQALQVAANASRLAP